MWKVIWSLRVLRPFRRYIEDQMVVLGISGGRDRYGVAKIAKIAGYIVGIYILYQMCFGSNGDYIVVMGDGVTKDLTVPKYVLLRALRAKELWQANPRAHVCALTQGNPGRPFPLNKQGFPLYDATVTAQTLIKVGVPATSILEEAMSYDTEGNVRYTRSPESHRMRWSPDPSPDSSSPHSPPY
jgi:hypothetical protein